MRHRMLKSIIHRATVTQADVDGHSPTVVEVDQWNHQVEPDALTPAGRRHQPVRGAASV
jgi:aspartate 1-decarboxylase